jgi:hypothetical protein
MHQQSHNSNGRADTHSIEPMMDRVKVAVAALLPALLLLASGQYLVSDAHASCLTGVSGYAIQKGKTRDSHPVCAPGITARVLSLRVARHFEKTHPQFQEPITAALAPERRLRSALTENQGPSSSSTWHFACRAAGNPRAPSSVP